jgi:hypothetical protein
MESVHFDISIPLGESLLAALLITKAVKIKMHLANDLPATRMSDAFCSWPK